MRTKTSVDTAMKPMMTYRLLRSTVLDIERRKGDAGVGRANDRGDRRRPEDDAEKLVADVTGRMLEDRCRRVADRKLTPALTTPSAARRMTRITPVTRMPVTALLFTSLRFSCPTMPASSKRCPPAKVM